MSAARIPLAPPSYSPNLESVSPTPEQVAQTCRRLALPGLVWLDTALPPASSGSEPLVSIVAACPTALWRGSADTWPAFENELASFHLGHPGGLAIGWVEYDGSYCFGAYTEPLFYHHREDRWSIPAGPPPWLDAIHASPPAAGEASRHGLRFAQETSAADFCRWVDIAREHIAAGDIYQVNLAHRFAAPWPPAADAFTLYRVLRAVSPAPEAAFLDVGGRMVACASPESFLRLDGRRARTRPIKGTRARGSEPVEDAAAARALLGSDKERAELLMITDLLRNDLGQVCAYGSITVPELRRLERFAQVFHLVSTVEGVLRSEVTHPAALRACMPGGSITGAPKKRAREIIAGIEPGPRGLYTGAIGYFGGDSSRFNIVIRTLIIENGIAHFHVGAGIVADSAPTREYEETLHKAAGILAAAASF